MTARVFITMLFFILIATTAKSQDNAKEPPKRLQRICFVGDTLVSLKAEAKRAQLENKSLIALEKSKIDVVAVIMDLDREANGEITTVTISTVRNDTILISHYLTLYKGDVDFAKVVASLGKYKL